MARQDILLDSEDDLMIQDNDFVVGESDEQHMAHILMSNPGFWRQFPVVGFGPSKYLKATGMTKSRFTRDVKVALEVDGYTNFKVDLTDGIKEFKITNR